MRVQLLKSYVIQNIVLGLPLEQPGEQFQIPLTTCISKGLVLTNPAKAAQMALETLSILKKDRNLNDKMSAEVVAKLGYSYEGVDVKMVDGGSPQLAEALYFLLTQPNYTNGSVYVQERIQVSCEARCFLINGCIEQMLYTRFVRIDTQGYVRQGVTCGSVATSWDWMIGFWLVHRVSEMLNVGSS